SWLIPPSATSSAPTKNVDSSEARNTAAWAISCGSAKRLMWNYCTMLDTRASRASEVNPMIGRLKIGVITGPGLITLTRIPRSTRSAEMVRAKDRSAENLLAPFSLQGPTLAWALGPGTKLQMIAVDDIGWFGARAFTDAAALNRREIDLAGDVRTMPEAAEILTEAGSADCFRADANRTSPAVQQGYGVDA